MLFKNKGSDPSMLVYACNPNTQEAEAGRLRVWGQCGLYSKTQKKKKKKSRCGRRRLEDHCWRPARAKKLVRPHLSQQSGHGGMHLWFPAIVSRQGLSARAKTRDPIQKNN
jgi:hypothetical protein